MSSYRAHIITFHDEGYSLSDERDLSRDEAAGIDEFEQRFAGSVISFEWVDSNKAIFIGPTLASLDELL